MIFQSISRANFSWFAALVVVAIIVVASAGSVHARSVQALQTPSGITVWLAEDHGVPLVALGFAIRGGSVLDPDGKDGLGSMLAEMVGEGAGELDAGGFKKALANVGTQLTFSVSQRAFTGGLVTLRKALPRSTELLKLALHSPQLDADDFERVRREELAALAFKDRSPQRIAIRRFYKRAFKGHPLARQVEGTPETLGSLTHGDLLSHRSRLIHRGGLHVVVVGAISAEDTVALVDDVFGNLPASSDPAAVARTKPIAFVETQAAPKGHAVETAIFALPLPPLGHADFFPAMVLNQILGSGNFDARLTREVRVKRGLTYAISSQLLSDPVASFSLGLLTTQPGNMDEAIEAVREIYDALAERGPSEKELSNAKSSLHGSYLLGIDTSARLANQLLGLWIDELPRDYTRVRKKGLEDVSLEDVRRVARDYFSPGNLRVLTLEATKRAQ
ncbi:MAG: pitrilysin family protein [Filomicrobium sp.]